MSVIKCGFEIEITDDKAFIEKVAKYMETEPELVTYDNISNFIEDSIFNDFSYGSGERSHQIRTDNQIADVARVRGIETDGGFYTSIDCDEIVEVVDKMYDEKQQGLTDGEFAKSVFDMLSKDDFKYLKDYQNTNVTFLSVKDFETSKASTMFGGESWEYQTKGVSDFNANNSCFIENSKKQFGYDLEINQEGIAEGWHISVDMNDKRNDYRITLDNDYIGKHIDLSTASALKELGLSQEGLNITGFIGNVQSILSQALYDVPSLDYINKNTLYVARWDNGQRRSGTAEALDWVHKDETLRDYGRASWEAQPDELKPFWKAFELYEKENYYHYVKGFYEKWVVNPSAYEPQKQYVMGKLSDYIATFDVCDNLIVNNYDGQTAGNHRVGNFKEALEELGIDFDVIHKECPANQCREEYHGEKTFTITVQTDDDKAFASLDYEANRNAIRHDKYMGDGKYDPIQTISKRDIVKERPVQQNKGNGKE